MRRSLFLIILLYAALAVMPRSVNAQSEPVQFLPGLTVYDVARDDRGFVWIGTDQGLARYDGVSFKWFYTSSGLPGNEVLRLIPGHDGRMWLQTFTRTLSFIKEDVVYNPENYELLADAVMQGIYSTAYARDDTLWAATDRGELIKITPETVTPLIASEDVANEILQLRVGDDGTIWIAYPKKLQFLGYKNQQTTLFHHSEYVSRRTLSNGERNFFIGTEGYRFTDHEEDILISRSDLGISSILSAGVMYSENLLISGTRAGLFISSKNEDGSWITRSDLEDKFISSLFKDDEGNVWVSTLADGLYLYPASYFKSNRFYPATFGLNQFKSVKILPDQSLLIGSTNGNLIREIDGKTEAILLNRHQTSRNTIEFIGSSGDILLICSTDGVYISQSGFSDPGSWDFVTSSAIKSMQVISPDSLLVSSSMGLHYLVKNPQTGRFVREDLQVLRTTSSIRSTTRPDRILFGTTSGLNYIPHGSFAPVTQMNNQLRRSQVTALIEAQPRIIAIGTNGDGIWLLDERSDEAVPLRYGTPEFNMVRQLVKDETGVLWAATESGVWRINPMKEWKTEQVSAMFVQSIDAANGMLATMNSNIAMLSQQYRTPLPPAEIKLDNPFISINSEPVDLDQLRNIEPATNLISVQINALFFRNRKSLEYGYRFANIDSTWAYSPQSEFLFRELKPGSYTLELKAAAEDRTLHSEIISIPFYINAPIWQKPVFWLFMISFFGFSGYTLVKRKIAKVRAQESKKLEEFTRIIELEQQALNAMMNPHFVFNVLNSIRFYMNEEGAEKAQQYLVKFSKLIRMQLEGSFNKMVFLEDEIAYLKLYIELEQIRLKHCVTFRVEVDEKVDEDEIEVPFMVIQPFVENAIWHGIQPKQAPGEIVLKITIDEQSRLVMLIEDDGVGMKKVKKAINKMQDEEDEHRSMAIRILQERITIIEKQTGISGSISFSERDGGGTIARILWPLT